jgi:hypothetical protein
MSHKFSVNQAVVFTPGAGEIISLATMATVTRLLPVEGAEYQYQIQVAADGLLRRVRENQLRTSTTRH